MKKNGENLQPLISLIPGEPLSGEEESKSLQELAAETRKAQVISGVGLACPQCACRDMRVVKVYHDENGSATSRRRECRNCKKRVTTTEAIKD